MNIILNRILCFLLYFRLSEMGQHVGVRILDLLFIREKGLKRETKLLNILLFIKSNVWKVRKITECIKSGGVSGGCWERLRWQVEIGG